MNVIDTPSDYPLLPSERLFQTTRLTQLLEKMKFTTGCC